MKQPLRINKAAEAAAWGRGNGLKLRACKGPHEFVELTAMHRYGCTHRCKLCGGEVHDMALGWYLMGLAHGKAGK